MATANPLYVNDGGALDLLADLAKGIIMNLRRAARRVSRSARRAARSASRATRRASRGGRRAFRSASRATSRVSRSPRQVIRSARRAASSVSQVASRSVGGVSRGIGDALGLGDVAKSVVKGAASSVGKVASSIGDVAESIGNSLGLGGARMPKMPKLPDIDIAAAAQEAGQYEEKERAPELGGGRSEAMRGRKRGRRALRIDLRAGNAGAGGTGINVARG